MSKEPITISAADDGQRLDRWLKKQCAGVPFAMLQKWLRTGQVRLDGKRVKGDEKIAEGQVVRLPPQAGDAAATKPKAKPNISAQDQKWLRSLILYQDEDMLALNKPAGLAVQGGSKTERHLDGMLDGLAENGVRPKLVHRLDKDTSGVLLLARHRAAAAELMRLFQGKELRKYYWALVLGQLKIPRGRIDLALAKEGSPGEQRVRADAPDGQRATSYYELIDHMGGKISWLGLWPVTGRTHQLRAHLEYIGHPIIGDKKYRAPQRQYRSQLPPELDDVLHLHARQITLPNWRGKSLSITAPLPPHMQRSFDFLGLDIHAADDLFVALERELQRKKRGK